MSSSRSLYRLFCKTPPSPTPVTSTPPRSPTPATSTTPPSSTPATSTTPPQSRKEIVGSLFTERNLSKVVENFKKSSETPRFRSQHRIYEYTVRRLASAKKFSSIRELLEHQKTYPDITKEGFAVRLISLYGKAGMFDDAYKMFDEMPQLKCQRTVMSFNALLHACVQSKRYDEAVKLFNELPSSMSVTPDVRTYNEVVQSLCETGSLDSAELLLDEMKSNGVEPSLFTFNILMNGLYSDGRFSDGERIWARMEESGIVPDIVSFNGKLGGLVNTGKISEAVELVEELKNRNLKPTIITYNVLIKWYSNNGRLDEATRVYDLSLKNECVPNRTTFEALIPCTCEKGDLDLALKLCEETLNSYCFISVGILQAVVDGLVKDSRVEEAEKLVKLAKSKKYGRSNLKVPSKDE